VAAGRYNPNAIDGMKKAIENHSREAARKLIKVSGSRRLMKRYLTDLAARASEVDSENTAG
jgi:hypothetical protein